MENLKISEKTRDFKNIFTHQNDMNQPINSKKELKIIKSLDSSIDFFNLGIGPVNITEEPLYFEEFPPELSDDQLF